MKLLAALAAVLLLAAPASAETVLLRFHATWCGPCRQMERTWSTVGVTVPVYDVDIDREPELARTWRVATVPQAVLVEVQPDGIRAAEKRRLVGARPRNEVLEFLGDKR